MSADQVKAVVLLVALAVYALLIETVSYVLRWRFVKSPVLGDVRQR
jgi:hypothetical protein